MTDRPAKPDLETLQADIQRLLTAMRGPPDLTSEVLEVLPVGQIEYLIYKAQQLLGEETAPESSTEAKHIYWLSITGRVTESPSKVQAHNVSGTHAVLAAGGQTVDMFFGGPLEQYASHLVKGQIITIAGSAEHFGESRDPPHPYVLVWTAIDFISPEENTRKKHVGGITMWRQAETATDCSFTFNTREGYHLFGDHAGDAVPALVRGLDWDVEGKIVVTVPQNEFRPTRINVPGLFARAPFSRAAKADEPARPFTDAFVWILLNTDTSWLKDWKEGDPLPDAVRMITAFSPYSDAAVVRGLQPPKTRERALHASLHQRWFADFRDSPRGPR
jgi:hypothetical protein